MLPCGDDHGFAAIFGNFQVRPLKSLNIIDNGAAIKTLPDVSDGSAFDLFALRHRSHHFLDGKELKINRNKLQAEEQDNCANGENRRPILRDVSLVIEAGEKIGIVGPSGAGKSQLMSLLVRATDPEQGSVFMSGYDLRTLSQETLLRYYGIIMQKSDPFEDTILGNLMFGVSHLDAEHLTNVTSTAVRPHEALSKAGLNASLFPQGIDTNIGYKGMRLSGGQQQRLQIAAAHFKLGLTPTRPRLILADEPTSSLDSLSELTVMAHLQDALPDGTTLLMVAHRLSTVAGMDRIVFVRPLADCADDSPQVTIHPSLADLYAVEPFFREMADAQGFRP